MALECGRRNRLRIVSASFTQVAFEGRPSAGTSDDISIDDISISPYPCPAPAACDFESGLCAYTNVKGTDQFDWTRGFGSTTSAFTGPSVDHTTNSVQGECLRVVVFVCFSGGLFLNTEEGIGDGALLVGFSF